MLASGILGVTVMPYDLYLHSSDSDAVISLMMFTGDRKLMGEFVNPTWLKVLTYAVATIIVGLNSWLLIQTFSGWLNPG